MSASGRPFNSYKTYQPRLYYNKQPLTYILLLILKWQTYKLTLNTLQLSHTIVPEHGPTATWLGSISHHMDTTRLQVLSYMYTINDYVLLHNNQSRVAKLVKAL